MQPHWRPALAEVGAVARPAVLIRPGANPGCRGVEMDVAAELGEVIIGLHHDDLVAPPKERPIGADAASESRVRENCMHGLMREGWLPDYGQTIEAPSDERGGNR